MGKSVRSGPGSATGAALYRDVRAVLAAARAGAYRAVNVAMTMAYWRVGRLIVEHEQGGRRRAAYGDRVLAGLSSRLTAEFGTGFTETNLKYMRLFAQAYPIRHALRDESAAGSGNALPSRAAKSVARIRRAPRDESALAAAAPALRPELSWTHYRALIGVEDPVARAWYEREAAEERWSTRQLQRQIAVLYYERLAASRARGPVKREARDKLAELGPESFVRDPYVLEFLDLKDAPSLRESTVEQAIIDNLQAFLLELGRGFSFVARQKRLRMDDEDFYVDLVFYNYLLKCFVLVDLKVGALTHQDIGQMDSYVRMFDAHGRTAGDNPTIGLILCSKKNEAVAKYSVLAEGRRLFAAKYVPVLPTEAELGRELARVRRAADARLSAERG
jgi:predicted nuclease of restriction endonuclease-like (RecB) superfamily